MEPKPNSPPDSPPRGLKPPDYSMVQFLLNSETASALP